VSVIWLVPDRRVERVLVGNHDPHSPAARTHENS
jgi:hypothetical protein